MMVLNQILQIEDVRGQDEVTISRTFGDEKCVSLYFWIYKKALVLPLFPLAFVLRFPLQTFKLKRTLKKNLRRLSQMQMTYQIQLTLSGLLSPSRRFFFFFFCLSYHFLTEIHCSLTAPERLTLT